MERIALVAGATGLVGSKLLKLLERNNSFEKVVVLSRKKISTTSAKTEIVLIDFDNIKEFSPMRITDIFCCLGTTMKKAGSKDAFYEVDHNYVVKLAELGKILGARGFYLISSLGADKNSRNFYSRVKGETENDVIGLNYSKTGIVRPSIIFGNRDERRVLEKLGIYIVKFISPIMLGPLKKYRGNLDVDIAETLVSDSLFEREGVKIYDSLEIGHKKSPI